MARPTFIGNADWCRRLEGRARNQAPDVRGRGKRRVTRMAAKLNRASELLGDRGDWLGLGAFALDGLRRLEGGDLLVRIGIGDGRGELGDVRGSKALG